jgi:hypothetical protein
MKRKNLIPALMLALATAVMAAITAPAEVIDNLEFFSDFELLSNLDLLEDEPAGAALESARAPSSGFVIEQAKIVNTSTTVFIAPGVNKVSSETVKASTSTRRGI